MYAKESSLTMFYMPSLGSESLGKDSQVYSKLHISMNQNKEAKVYKSPAEYGKDLFSVFLGYKIYPGNQTQREKSKFKT